MIIYASLKTDIAYYYLPWLKNKLQLGCFYIEKNISTVEQYDIKTNPIEKIYFWTKNPIRLNKEIDYLKNYTKEIEVVTSISLYEKYLEPKIKEKEKILNNIRKISYKNITNSFQYGPIFYTENINYSWHISQFHFLCGILKNYVKNVYISFNINEEPQKNKNISIIKLTEEEEIQIKNNFLPIAKKYGLILKITPTPEDLKKNEIDIGLKNTCPNLCLYCPYIQNRSSIVTKYENHNIDSDFIFGNIEQKQKIQKMIIDNQIDSELLYSQTNLF